MEVRYKRAFIKDLKRLSADIRKSIEHLSLDEIPCLNNVNEIKHLKKIKGYDNFFRIKIGDYRIGIEYRDHAIVFMRVLHRKEIYRYFP